jgi:hypothetical protein
MGMTSWWHCRPVGIAKSLPQGPSDAKSHWQ